jgi:hypothetical protein
LIRVGYVPYSKDLQHPADRRRLATWAKDKGYQLNTSNPLDSDILILSNEANFGFWLKRAKQPVIIDLVDGYLGENPNFIRDVLRNILRSVRGTSSLRWLTYTRHLRNACRKSAAIIVASPEQHKLVNKFNSNVFVILDDHSELNSDSQSIFPFDNASIPQSRKRYIFWEGFGFTLKHFKFIAKDLDRFLDEYNWGMYLLTVEKFPRWGGYLGNIVTKELIADIFPRSSKSIQIIPWTIDNLKNFSAKSEFAVIPISASDDFAVMKSENKLLSMWTLRLPTIFSNIPSYNRVAIEAKQESACVNGANWFEDLQRMANSGQDREGMKRDGMKYINETHLHAHLVGKWDEAINTVLMGNRT